MARHSTVVAVLALALAPLGCAGVHKPSRQAGDTGHEVSRVASPDAPGSASPAEQRTTNFVIRAATPELAAWLGEWAEYHRSERARTWLGRELPPWTLPCTITVSLTAGDASGSSSFAFERGRVAGHAMQLEGRVERLSVSGLPHEVTHLILAHHFGQPVPRWADEGAAVWSEDEVSHRQHEQLCREVVQSPDRRLSLRKLFRLTKYPRDALVLYAEGYSVTAFLIDRGGPQHFTAFVGDGLHGDWDQALQRHYGYRTIEELEKAWLARLNTSEPVANRDRLPPPRPLPAPLTQQTQKQPNNWQPHGPTVSLGPPQRE